MFVVNGTWLLGGSGGWISRLIGGTSIGGVDFGGGEAQLRGSGCSKASIVGTSSKICLGHSLSFSQRAIAVGALLESPVVILTNFGQRLQEDLSCQRCRTGGTKPTKLKG